MADARTPKLPMGGAVPPATREDQVTIRDASPQEFDDFEQELIDTMIEAGFTPTQAKAEVVSLIRWCQEDV